MVDQKVGRVALLKALVVGLSSRGGGGGCVGIRKFRKKLFVVLVLFTFTEFIESKSFSSWLLRERERANEV